MKGGGRASSFNLEPLGGAVRFGRGTLPTFLPAPSRFEFWRSYSAASWVDLVLKVLAPLRDGTGVGIWKEEQSQFQF